MAQKASAEQRTLLLTTGAALLASTTVYLAIHRPDLLRRLAFWRKGPQPACVGRVSHLFVFPLKSGAAIQVQECPVDVSGFHYDREWMIVTQAPEGEMAKMLTIREYPHMARIQPSFDGGGDEMRGQFYGNLVLTLPDTNESFIVQEPVQPKSVKCMIWRTQIEASDQGDEVSEFLTKYFRRNEAKVEVPVRLLRMATPTRRLSEDGKYLQPRRETNASQYQLLIRPPVSVILVENLCGRSRSYVPAFIHISQMTTLSLSRATARAFLPQTCCIGTRRGRRSALGILLLSITSTSCTARCDFDSVGRGEPYTCADLGQKD
eukprot:TRINITY_DN11091_c0_g1_i4.p1 TRINITY_DN11091_c0_g1~~TRINITY_DN11091_c0_g1_i4.p1  ORF type:complete len:320 (-),score=15.62 TRINITY_DN11091_c0_g1_i4:8-967(-)